MSGRSVTVRAPAKVNVQLAVGGRRADGFHELANVYMAVSAYDEVTVSPGEGLSIGVSGTGSEHVPTDGSNLAARAAALLAQHAGVDPDVHIEVVKHLPVAGGMAGGSADAAGTLVACDALWGLDTEREVLDALAAELGSDVPFSLRGGTALGRGRGERLTPLAGTGSFHWVFAIARFGMSTPEVYGALERRRLAAGLPHSADELTVPQPTPALLDALSGGKVRALAAALSNDLEQVAVELRPELAHTFRAGRSAGALAGLLCGTGSTTAFLVDGPADAERVAGELRRSGTCASALTAHGPVAGPAGSVRREGRQESRPRRATPAP